MVLLQLPAFPKARYVGWEKEVWVQHRVRPAWQRVAGLWFFGCSRGHGLGGRSLPFFQNCVAFVSYRCKLTL